MSASTRDSRLIDPSVHWVHLLWVQFHVWKVLSAADGDPKEKQICSLQLVHWTIPTIHDYNDGTARTLETRERASTLLRAWNAKWGLLLDQRRSQDWIQLLQHSTLCPQGWLSDHWWLRVQLPQESWLLVHGLHQKQVLRKLGLLH